MNNTLQTLDTLEQLVLDLRYLHTETLQDIRGLTEVTQAMDKILEETLEDFEALGKQHDPAHGIDTKHLLDIAYELRGLR